MVTNTEKHTRKTPAKQGPGTAIPKPMKIGASTPYDPVTLCYSSLSL
jgi:hypothetical protein